MAQANACAIRGLSGISKETFDISSRENDNSYDQNHISSYENNISSEEKGTSLNTLHTYEEKGISS